MKRIRIRNIPEEDNVEHYLLESKELKGDEIPTLVKVGLKKDEVVEIIDEFGVTGSANQIIVIKKNHNTGSSKLLNFEDDSEFIYL